MNTTVLVVGGTGRTGARVVQQLADAGVNVRAIVRSRARVSPTLAENPRVTLIEADLLSLSDDALRDAVTGCDAILSCLGHVMSLRGVLGPPFDLVTRAVRRLCDAVEVLKPETPVKVVVMTSVSVNHPDLPESARSSTQRALLWVLRGLVPPARDNQAVADFLFARIGSAHAYVQWVLVRPDTLLPGDVSAYTPHEKLVSSLFAPEQSRMANVAHFMCSLVTDAALWETWRGKCPVVVDRKD